MKPIAELEQTAIRRVSAPHPERDWVRCAANAPYFQTESGAAWAPVGHNNASFKIFTFEYHPSDQYTKVFDANQNKKHFLSENAIQRLKIEEPTSVAVKEQIDTMQVEMNKLIVSIKINEILNDPQDKIKRELALNLLFDLYFSKSSSLYNEWLEKGYINETFSASFTQERDYAFILMGGDQDDYELLQKTIFNFIDHVQDLEIAEDDFERIKRKTIGNFINSYNSPESIANTFSRYYFEGICSFDLVDYVSKMTLADINEVKRYFNKEYASSYIVKKDK